MFGQKLTERWGHSVVLDNRPGATGMIGMDAVAHANPDGYTLLVMNVGHQITALLFPKLGFDDVKDFAPISVIATTPVIVVVNPGVNAHDDDPLDVPDRSAEFFEHGPDTARTLQVMH